MTKFESQEDHERARIVNRLANRLALNGNWSDIGRTLEEALTPDIIVEGIEKMVNQIGQLPPNLENNYLLALEDIYTDEIKGCEQDPMCINDLLRSFSTRVSSIGVSEEAIKRQIEKINSWAYLADVS